MRYPAYRGQRPAAAGVTFEIYTSQAAAYTAVQAGQVDITAIGPASYAAAEQDMPASVVAYAAPAIDYLGFPLYNGYFGNKLIREAISLALLPGGHRRRVADGAQDRTRGASRSHEGQRNGARAR